MFTKNLNPRKKRQIKIRQKISGTAAIPRLCVFRSNLSFSAQLIDDQSKKTLASISTKEAKLKANLEDCQKLGALMGEKIKSLKIKTVVFDRAGYAYHGKVKSFAEGCRSQGIKF